jgi:hypothetical protein
VKDAYLGDPRASTGGKYFGKILTVNTSGRMMTNERPCGSQVIMSDRDDSLKIARRRCGNMSRLQFPVPALLQFDNTIGAIFRASSSSLTIMPSSVGGLFAPVEVFVTPVLTSLTEVKFAKAVAASTK